MISSIKEPGNYTHLMSQVRNGFDIRPLQKPLFNLLSLRPVYAQHTRAEERMLEKYAHARKAIVEIGVAEGASAIVLREAADPSGIVYLIDPYTPGRVPGVNFSKLVAHRYVQTSNNARVQWIEQLSFDAVKTWKAPIDFLFIDGDHSYEGCVRDWKEWSPFVTPDGYVAFHDARVFEGGWADETWGPVRTVEEAVRSGWKIVDSADSLVIVARG